MNASAPEVEVAVIGAGLVGTALSLALASRGFSVTVIEKDAAVPEALRGELIMPAGVDAIDRIGLGQLRKSGLETQGVVLHHPAFQGGSFEIGYQTAPPVGGANPASWRPHGLCGWRRPMYEALRTALRETPGVQLLEGARVSSIGRRADGSHELELEGAPQPRLATRMLVAADGRSSRTRKLLGFEPTEDVQATFVQGFVGRGRAHELRRVHVGVHPLGAAFVFPFPDGGFRSTFEFEAGHLDALRTADPLATHLGLLREALPELWEELGGAAIEPLTPLQMHPGHTTLLAGIVEDGVALVGDAAGCIDPFTGYGMSIGLVDAEQLADAVAAAGGDYSARSLRAYERRRQPRIAARREATDQLAYIFLNKGEPFAPAYAERLAQRWQGAPMLWPFLALQFGGYDLPLVPSAGLKHHVFGLL